jgi:enoyl-CoA hydratase/carnithine racemase
MLPQGSAVRLAPSAPNYVGTIEIQQPPHNFFDTELIQQVAEAMEELDKDDSVRAALLKASHSARAVVSFNTGPTALESAVSPAKI